MAFYDDEKSIEQAMPIHLLAFTDGTRNWRYTTAAVDYVYGGNTYTAQAGLKCGKISIARNVLRSRFEVTAPWSCPLVQQYVAAPPEAVVSLTLYRIHQDTVDDSGHTAATFWQGYVQSVSFGARRLATIRCVPNYTDLGRGGLYLRDSRTCQVPLYSQWCGRVKANYQVGGSVSAVDGFTVTSATFGAQAAGYWVGGEFEARDTTRLIIAHSGNDITLATVVPNLSTGDSFVACPGCDHIWESDCVTIFSNKENFRGAPHIPLVNPNSQGVQ